MAQSFSTLADYQSANMRLSVQCGGCRRHSKLDWQPLIDRLGPDFDLIARKPYFLYKLKCQYCGHSADDLSISYGGAAQAFSYGVAPSQSQNPPNTDE